MGKAPDPALQSNQLWAEHRGHGTHLCLADPSRSWANAGDKQRACTGLWPHTANTLPSAKPGYPNMGIRKLHFKLAASKLLVSTVLGGVG